MKSSCFDDAEEEPEEVLVTPRRDTSLCAVGSPYTPMKSCEAGVNHEGQEVTSAAVCSVVAELVELSIDKGKSNIEVEARSVQHDTLSAAGGLTSEESLRRVGINLLGGALSNQQQHRMLEELVAGASHVMLAKGFSSIQQGIQINEVMDKSLALLSYCSLVQ